MLANYTIDGFENIQYQGFGKLKYVENRLTDLYTRFGYCQVETPTFESYDFYAQDDSVNANDLFKLISSTGKVLALKPDATLPITRMAAINHHDPEEIVKFSYLTNIYRDFSAPEIQKKETTQTGIEYFGNATPECDAEVIALAILSLRILGLTEIHIDLGHVGFIHELYESLSLPDADRKTLSSFIENKNIGDIKDFLRNKDLPEDAKRVILELPRLYGEPSKVFSRMRELSLTEGMLSCVTELSEIYESLDELGLSSCVQFDLGFTNSMNYYTGMLFKGYIENYGESIVNGGRYDDLSSRFGIDRPACGFGLDLLRLMDSLEKKTLLTEQEHAKSVVLYSPGEKETAYRFLTEKRKTGSGEMFIIKDGNPLPFTEKLLKNPHYGNADIYFMHGQIDYFDGKAFIPASDKHIELYEKSGGAYE